MSQIKETANFTQIDYWVFIISLILSALIGVYYAWVDRKRTNNQEYLTGGNNLSIFPVTLSLVASFLSSNTLLGVPAEVYLLGTQITLHLIGFTCAVLMAAHIFMPIYYRLNLTSVYKYLVKRYGSNVVRITGSVGFILCTMPYMGVVLFGPALALSAVTPLNVQNSILLVGIICTFYTSIGGIKAVVWTDVMQTILMLVGLLIVVIRGAIEVGGIGEAFRIADSAGRIQFFNTSTSLYRGDTIWAVIISSMVGWGGTYCVKQTQVQRYCSMSSPGKARKTLYYNIPGVAIISLLAILSGIIVYAKYHECDPVQLGLIERHDQLLPYFVMETMSDIPGLSGLFVAAVFSGSLSTLSSGMNALATVTWDDILKPVFRNTPEKRVLWINKFTAMFYGVLGIGLAFVVGRLGTVLQASISLAGAVTGPLMGLFLLGIFFPCSNAIGAMIGSLSGFFICMTIATGAMVHPRPKLSLPLGISQCPHEILDQAISRKPDLLQELAKKAASSPDYHPEGMNQLYHISYMYIAVIGCLAALVIGLIFSLLTGGNKRPMDQKLISPISRKLCSCCMPPEPDEKEQTDNSFATQGMNGFNNMVIIENGSKIVTIQPKTDLPMNNIRPLDAHSNRSVSETRTAI